MKYPFQSISKINRGLMIAGLLLLATGCNSTAQKPEPAFSLPNGIEWPYWPLSMRFHPLTRITDHEQTELKLLEARLEFTDREDDITKCYGDLTLRLYDLLASGESGDLLSSWEINLRDLEINRQHFDDITQTYLMRLEVDAAILTDRMELHAKFNAEDGRDFDSSFIFRP